MPTWLLSTTPQGAFIPLCTWTRSPLHSRCVAGLARTSFDHGVEQVCSTASGTTASPDERFSWTFLRARDIPSEQLVDPVVYEDQPSLLPQVALLKHACGSRTGLSSRLRQGSTVRNASSRSIISTSSTIRRTFNGSSADALFNGTRWLFAIAVSSGLCAAFFVSGESSAHKQPMRLRRWRL